VRQKPVPNHNSRVAITRQDPKGDAAQVLLLKCLLVPPRPEDEIFYEVPGGDKKSAEEPEVTARRETKEETGLKVPKKVKLRKVYLEELRWHTKHGFQVRRRECRGRLRKDAHDDGGKRIVGYEWVDVRDAPSMVPPSKDSRSQHDFLCELEKLPKEELI
jgi:8-oxo-dGTP pyrophosphatase MutT (NUDIX family)